MTDYSNTKRYQASIAYFQGVTWPKTFTSKMRHKRPDYSKQRSGPGENGAAVHLSGKEKEKGEADMKKWFMNVVAR